MTGNLLLSIGLLVLATVGLIWVLWEVQQLGNDIEGLRLDIEELATDLTALEGQVGVTTPGGRFDTTPVPLVIHGPWAPTTEEIPVVGRHRAPR